MRKARAEKDTQHSRVTDVKKGREKKKVYSHTPPLLGF